MFVMPRITGIVTAPVTPTMYFIRECRSSGLRSICGLYARDRWRVTSVARRLNEHDDTAAVAACGHHRLDGSRTRAAAGAAPRSRDVGAPPNRARVGQLHVPSRRRSRRQAAAPPLDCAVDRERAALAA